MMATGWIAGRALGIAASMAWLVSAACGGDDGGKGGDDAGQADAAVDASGLDAAADASALDAGADAEPGPGRSGDRLLLATFIIAGNSDSASDLGMDLDGDGFTENALGSAMAGLAESAEIDPEIVFVQGVARGTIIQLLAVDVDGKGQGALRGYVGRDLDGDPSDNLSGDESFAVDETAPPGTRLPAERTFNTLEAGPGEIPLRIPLAAPFPGIVTARLLGVRIEAERQEDGSFAGHLGGAFLASDIDILLVPLVADGLTGVLARDCPSGPDSCEEGSAGYNLSLVVDLDRDGIITANEMRNSFIFGRLFGADLDLLDADGNYAPNQDGVAESLSWGMGFVVTGAAFELP